MTFTATARIACPAPERCAKKLITELKSDGSARGVAFEAGSGSLTLDQGEVSLLTDDGILLLHIECEQQAQLSCLEQRVGMALLESTGGQQAVTWRRSGDFAAAH